jgi:hypothetical protein
MASPTMSEIDGWDNPDDYEDEDFDSDKERIIRAKWTIDGAATLSEAAALSRAFANELEDLEADGWQLTQPVEDDYGFCGRVWEEGTDE